MANVHSKTAITAFAICLLLGCASAPPPDTRAADEAAIRKADADWVTAAQSKQVDAWMTFYSEDAVVLPANDKVATSKESIRKAIGDLLGLPGLSITWKPAKVEVARSGDLAYLYGAYEMAWKEANGKPATDRGKNIEIWKKQSDGGWKCIVDTWNSDLPAAPSSPNLKRHSRNHNTRQRSKPLQNPKR